MAMRSALIEGAKTPVGDDTTGEVEFLRSYFGDDFLAGIAVNGALPWFKVMPKFFAKNRSTLQSGAQMVIGEVCVPRNMSLIDQIFDRVTSGKEFTTGVPLRIAWLRPSVDSWGRSIAFLDGVRALRENAKKLLKGAVVIELWENRARPSSKLDEQLKRYWPWFDDVRYFRAATIPSRLEMILVGDYAGIAVTHAFTPPQACFPCPVGVAFDQNNRIGDLVSTTISPELRSLPILKPKAGAVKKKEVIRRPS